LKSAVANISKKLLQQYERLRRHLKKSHTGEMAEENARNLQKAGSAKAGHKRDRSHQI
jgi:uncharacterized membrane-anchored protein YhcB (DUF1043 family)